jgi:anti-sigma B factor antagonist
VAAQDQLKIDLRVEKDRLVLCLSGELDLANAPSLQSEIESSAVADAAMVVLDLQQLEFVDSTGLRVLLAAHELAQERGQEFAITPGSPQVQRLLSITRVNEHLRTIASSDEMLV